METRFFIKTRLGCFLILILLLSAMVQAQLTISYSVSGPNLQLQWPANLGWILQSQTNPLLVGLGTNWVDVPGSELTNQWSTPLQQANTTVFFRLRSSSSATGVTNYFYQPETITNISGRAFSDSSSPAHLLNMSTFGETAAAVSTPITWAVGDFTGLYPASPVNNFQRGISNGWYGSCAVQISGSQEGCMVHTFSIPGGSGYNYNLANAQVNYKWNYADGNCPWSSTGAFLSINFNMQIPAVYMANGAVGYVYTSVLLQDTNGNICWLQPQIFDTRGAPNTEYCGWDPGTKSAYANTYYSSNQTRYCSMSPGSSASTGSHWTGWKSYGVNISTTNLLNAINDINHQFGGTLSTNPADYRLILLTIQDEIYWPVGNGYIGMSVSNLSAYAFYPGVESN